MIAFAIGRLGVLELRRKIIHSLFFKTRKLTIAKANNVNHKEVIGKEQSHKTVKRS